MKKILIMACATTSLMFANGVQDIVKTETPITKMAKSSTKIIDKKQSSPFLILGKMPHLTKMVKTNWDNPLLELTDTQKEKLVKVRKNTMISVTKLKKEILPLEKEVVEATMSGKKPESLKIKVDQISKLKAKATMVHIKCIYDTKKILDTKQLEFLLK